MKLLIADDEIHIRSGLRNGIPWEEFGIDLVLTAEDGETALELCKKERPEIIITDIRMPGISGLGLARLASEKWGAKKVIILSGYSEFKYAKEAIRLGVADYLLKPVKTQELRELVEKCIEEIKQDIKVKGMLHQKEVKRVLDGELTPQYLKKMLYGEANNCPNEMILAAVRRDERYGRAAKDGWTNFEMLHGVAEALISQKQSILLAMEDSLVLLMDIRSREDRNSYEGACSETLRKLNRMVPSGITCSMGVSSKGGIGDIAKLYLQAESALKHRLYLRPESCIFYEQLSEGGKKSYPLLHFDKSAIEESILLFKIDRLRELIHLQFQNLYENNCIEKREVQELCLVIKNVIFDTMKSKGVDIVGIMDQNQEMFERQLEFSSLESYEEWIGDYCYLLLKGLEDLEGKNYSTVIFMAVDYIYQHYNEDITLKGLAEEVKKSTSYFSCIFKKEMGINFNEYLNQIRIRKAKELLRVPDAVIYEVAEKTGFHDYKYFTKVFKKQCGCSPSVYSRKGKT